VEKQFGCSRCNRLLPDCGPLTGCYRFEMGREHLVEVIPYTRNNQRMCEQCAREIVARGQCHPQPDEEDYIEDVTPEA